jgi:hypothetical protein
MRVISAVAEKLLASQEKLCSVEFTVCKNNDLQLKFLNHLYRTV